MKKISLIDQIRKLESYLLDTKNKLLKRTMSERLEKLRDEYLKENGINVPEISFEPAPAEMITEPAKAIDPIEQKKSDILKRAEEWKQKNANANAIKK